LSSIKIRSAGLRGDQAAFSKPGLDILLSEVFKVIAWKLVAVPEKGKQARAGIDWTGAIERSE
jgi:hypothetical protein